MMSTIPDRRSSWAWSLDPPKLVVAGVLMLLAVGLAAVVLDDVRAHQALPADTVYAHRYMDGMVRLDPTAMWDSFSLDAQRARGGDFDAWAAYMRLGTHPPEGAPNAYRLAARVPLDGGRTLLYYVVALQRTSHRGERLVVPIVVDATGRVEDGGSDGISFVPPRARD